MKRPWTLRTRLVVYAVTLIAVVAAVIGSVTAIAFQSYMDGKLDDQLRDIARVAQQPPPGSGKAARGGPEGGDEEPLAFIGRGAFNTFGAVVSGGAVTESKVVKGPDARESTEELTDTQKDALEGADVAPDGEPHDVELPGLGRYRVQLVPTGGGTSGGGTSGAGAVGGASGGDTSVLVGIPTAEVDKAVTTLILVEVCVTGAGLIAAGIAGAAMVGVALRPLRRVAATATRVSELPLHSGEVALLERVPDAEADPRTEVGQVGAALNRMLGHVGSALEARQKSETRVRQFVADASHELRTPLASIRGYAELTRRGRENTGPDTRHALGRIESEAERMTGMVEDLLLLARLDAGRPLSYESTDLSPLVIDAVSDARVADRTTEGAAHHWRLELPEVPATVLADPTRIQQVLVNLLANARTHTPPGTTVTVRVRQARRELPWVTLEVEDNGPGIPAELQPRVFERFARGDASRSRHAGSTGLGLAIVQAVVSAHGGVAEVRSVPGSTVFAVHLPADAVYADEAENHRGTRGERLGDTPLNRSDTADDTSAAHSQTHHRLSTRM
ncbi:two-component system, OmpR family, sensor kinase [Streptomyces sp. LamerLS-316]|uniref:sensor histidine kinase n=1 Tax=unclassified Streptomyces TaxID=2593676 RepID=UPI000823BF78|nr:HAMP domain-containing sensor histidine kinase [Streptomyces sp. LamerLS-316]MYQ41701.1 HAMP domain-containing protein [Streptomyces sp. SID4921]SCK27715.1 two-component system, OmpR family, sensor kinase [Streptomyces sp. LamerLS-316]